MFRKYPITILASIIFIAGMAYFVLRGEVEAPSQVGNALEKQDLVHLITPQLNDLVKSPLVLQGEARGYWYFEASFPARIYDARGIELGVVPVQATDEYMTEDFVPFSAVLEFQTPTTATGLLVLEKDNPSGLPENADELRIPIRFK